MIELLEKTVAEGLPYAASCQGRNLFMPGDGRYQPKPLQAFLGYDQWAGWLIIVEWFWMKTLAAIGVMPAKDARLLTTDLLYSMLNIISTTRQDDREYGRDGQPGTNHDIIALLELMKRSLPKALHKWLHLGATSYDIINTAYALIIHQTFERVFWPKLQEVDQLWRGKIAEFAGVVQTGRTHLQDAIPVTVGFWLSTLHHQFHDCACAARSLADDVPGKFTGAVGTSAALIAMLGSRKAGLAQKTLMASLDLKPATYSTQIAPPQPTARFYSELMLLSGVLGNVGEDVRLLTSTPFGEIVAAKSVSSRSSAMSHKRGNPIVAENMCGMHVNIIAAFMKVMLTLITDLQRDLRWSSVMRSYSEVMVFLYQQLSATSRLLKSLDIDPDRIRQNFDRNGKLVVAELLHLGLQMQGCPDAHEFVNQQIVPAARTNGTSLPLEMTYHLQRNPKDRALAKAWAGVPASIVKVLKNPKLYIGDAIQLAEAEAKNQLN